jgi:esterase/lipase superfamily enzyme
MALVAETTTGTLHEIFVGTNREEGPDGMPGPGRSERMSFERHVVSVPPGHEAGQIEWPPVNGRPDPRRDFVSTEADRFAEVSAFRSALRASLRRNGGEAVIFVHGYNSTHGESTYRMAQFSHDLKLRGTLVLYSWASAAEPLGYVYDRDSALFSRDGLERLIREVDAAGATSILLVAHSMGTALTMETLRQIGIGGDRGLLRRMGGVVLISPDIDVDVFRAQAKAVEPLPQPFLIFASGRDQVLRLSARLTGQRDRLGTLTDLSRLADLPVTVLDTGAFSKGAGHFNVGQSPALVALLSRVGEIDRTLETERLARTGLLPGAVLTVQSATAIILRPVADLGTAR